MSLRGETRVAQSPGLLGDGVDKRTHVRVDESVRRRLALSLENEPENARAGPKSGSATEAENTPAVAQVQMLWVKQTPGGYHEVPCRSSDFRCSDTGI